MKKILSLALAFMLLLTACGSKSDANTPKDGKSLADVLSEVESEFCEKFGVEQMLVMPTDIDTQYLSDMVGLSTDDIEESAGQIALTMTNSDAFFAVKAKDEKTETVTEAFSSYLKSLVAQYERYSVCNSYERAQAGRVYVKGDYVFFIVVGMTPDDDESTEIYPEQVQFVMDCIDSKFN
jgi:hypothetical protein